MNEAAEQHLDQAIAFAAKSDNYYWQAGQEIVSALAADSTLSQREVARRMERSETWVRDVVRHATSAQPDAHVEWHRGSHGTKEEAEQAVRKALNDNPAEMAQRALKRMSGEQKSDLVHQIIAEGDRLGRITRTQEELGRPASAYTRLGNHIASVDFAVRMLARGYQEFKAVVSDEDLLGAAEERLIELRAETDRKLGEIVSGSYEEALAALTEEE